MKKGFTLIELLVVIAIIAILAAILFPVFAQAREKARQASCLSNTKQMGTAIQLYVDDYDECFPALLQGGLAGYGTDVPTQYTDATHRYSSDGFGQFDKSYGLAIWMDEIYSYVKNINMYYCPSAKSYKGCFGYGMNFHLAWPGYVSGHTWAGDGNPVLSLTQIKNPSQLVFITDSAVFEQAGIYYSRFLITPMWQAWQDQKCFRHNNGCNYTMCDGHATHFKRLQGPTGNGADAVPADFATSGLGNSWWDYSAQ